MHEVAPSRLVPTDPRAYRRLRRRARAWTAVVVAVVATTVAEIALRVGSDDPQTQASAASTFFHAALVLACLVPVLWFQWRRSFRARPQRLSVHDGDGAWIGVPELDEPPRPHLTLGADGPAQHRW
jgi:predicted membrane channel-forming protein YqfA (hemolysin III family)